MVTGEKVPQSPKVKRMRGGQSILYLQCLDLTKSLGESCPRGSPVILTINDCDVIRVTVPK